MAEERDKLLNINSPDVSSGFELLVTPELYEKYEKRTDELLKKFPNISKERLWGFACFNLTDEEIEKRCEFIGKGEGSNITKKGFIEDDNGNRLIGHNSMFDTTTGSKGSGWGKAYKKEKETVMYSDTKRNVGIGHEKVTLHCSCGYEFYATTPLNQVAVKCPKCGKINIVTVGE